MNKFNAIYQREIVPSRFIDSFVGIVSSAAPHTQTNTALLATSLFRLLLLSVLQMDAISLCRLRMAPDFYWPLSLKRQRTTGRRATEKRQQNAG
jgi:hypothetical protein